MHIYLIAVLIIIVIGLTVFLCKIYSRQMDILRGIDENCGTESYTESSPSETESTPSETESSSDVKTMVTTTEEDSDSDSIDDLKIAEYDRKLQSLPSKIKENNSSLMSEREKNNLVQLDVNSTAIARSRINDTINKSKMNIRTNIVTCKYKTIVDQDDPFDKQYKAYNPQSQGPNLPVVRDIVADGVKARALTFAGMHLD